MAVSIPLRSRSRVRARGCEPAPGTWPARPARATTARQTDWPPPLQRSEIVTASAVDRNQRVAALDTLIPLADLAGPVTLEITGQLANGQVATQTVGFVVRPR